MWLSQFVDFLKSSRAAVLGLTPPRRAGRSRPLAVEPLEDRLVLTGEVALDITPGNGTIRQPPVVITLVLQMAVNWFDLNWPQPATNPPGNNGGMERSGGITPQVDLLALATPSLPALGGPAVGKGKGSPHGATATLLPTVVDTAPPTPAKIDAFFQHPAAVGSL